LDSQTLDGKAPAGVARMARRCAKPCFAVVGQMEEKAELVQIFDRVFVLGSSADSEIADTLSLLRRNARELGKLLSALPR